MSVKSFQMLWVYTLLMLCVPAGAWAAAYVWLPENALNFSSALPYWLWLTDMGTPPYAVLTTICLTAALVWLLRRRYAWQTVLLMCALSLGVTQGVKSAMKRGFQEPRPFVTALALSGKVNTPDDFYRLPDNEQNALVYTQMKNSDGSVAAHQADHHDYSFPSGHTIFAVSWLLLAVGFGCRQCVCAPLACWAGAMLLSRLLLGMHYPIDLLVSTLVAAVLHTGLFAWVLPRLPQRFPLVYSN
ncbi:MAG: phosphatase PAP2 family protein [Conchiformibius sp.]|nr:phosphatase PAP2 family protein [Conchiformibius sp.]